MSRICIIGSGAGGASVAWRLAQGGHEVVILEKGPRFVRKDMLKDEVIQNRRGIFKPRPEEEYQVRRWYYEGRGFGPPDPTTAFWNGNVVGGSSELMSGFMMRLKPHDFRLRSTYGPVADATVADWPIRYEDLEPYYAEVERLVGISGRIDESLPDHLKDTRSTPTLPMPPCKEHPFAAMVDATATRLHLHSIPLPRAVLSRTDEAQYPGRTVCDYNGYCGSYMCTTGAKGSAGAAFVPRAEATGRCQVIHRAHVRRLESDARGRVVRAHWVDRDGKAHTTEADLFIVACQAVETARLLLKSTGPRHPDGLANGSGQVGRNFVSSTFGAGWGEFPVETFPDLATDAARKEPFVHRIIQDHYRRDGVPHNGGTLNFLLMHPNPIGAATYQALWDQKPLNRRLNERVPLWGPALKRRLVRYFREVTHLRFEVFGEWLPSKDCRVMLDPKRRDKYGDPVAHVQQRTHPASIKNAKWLVNQGLAFLREMGAVNTRSAPVYGTPSTNLLAGTCRFGEDPATSVLDGSCKAHDVDNLYVTDGSFFPSGGSVPFTFTIYANALRVADGILKRLG